MADLKERAAKIAKEAAAAVAGYRRKQAAQSQQVWCIVNESGMLDFSMVQDQIVSVPVYESQQDAQLELDNFGDESMEGWSVVEATITFKDAANSMGGVYDR